MSSPCGLNEGQIQAEILDCENDTLTNIPSHQIRFFRVFFFSLAFVRYGNVADRKKYKVYLKTPLTCAVARAH